MKTKINRRNFFHKSTQAGVAGCLLLMSPRLTALNNFSFLLNQDVPDPKKMNTYCGYNCTEECQFMQASLKNDPELKKKVYDEWGLKERLGFEFDADRVVCFGCKVKDRLLSELVTTCTVRACCLKKGYDACIQCEELKNCDKALWAKFPDFHKSVIEMQKKYAEAQG